MDTLTKEQRRKNMKVIKSKDTDIENILAKKVWSLGYRYRRNCKSVFGKPDIVIRKYNIAIFCDSEFWHGKNFKKNPYKVKTHRKFWHDKIERNMQRDKLVNKTLKKQGWAVLRFWEMI